MNPASGRRGGARRLRRYGELLDRHLPDAARVTTTRPGEEGDLAERALEEGYDTLVAVGGDGTWSHVADRIVRSGRSGVRLGVLPSGTGNDFGRGLRIRSGDPEGAVRVLARGATRRVDVGRMSTPTRHAGSGEEPVAGRTFLNLVGFGFDIAVIDAAARARFLRGELLYKVTALQQLFRFPGFAARVRPGGGHAWSGEHLMITVSNGPYFGGGFPIAPEALPYDGLLHACAIGDAKPLTRLKLFNLAERGAHVSSEHVRLESSPAFTISFEQPPRCEFDGDVYEALDASVTIEVVPGALEVLVPEGEG